MLSSCLVIVRVMHTTILVSFSCGQQIDFGQQIDLSCLLCNLFSEIQWNTTQP